MEGISVARCAAFSVCRARSRSSGALSLGCASICVWTCCCHHRCFIQAGSMSPPGSMDSSRFDGCERFCVQMHFFHEQRAMRRIARSRICVAARLWEPANRKFDAINAGPNTHRGVADSELPSVGNIRRTRWMPFWQCNL